MHNIHELEKRWFNYKLKNYLPHVGALITSALILIYIFNAVDFPENKDEQKLVLQEKVVQYKIKEEESKVNTSISKQEVPADELIIDEDKTLTLSPSLDFIKNLRVNSINTYEPKTKVTNTVQNTNTNIIEDIKIEEVETKEKLATITMIKQETIDDINHVVKRFKKNNDPALSLFIAKKYYKLKDYHKAYNYALLTNEINNNIDESWILFCKSLVRLNKKNMAINTLIKYIEQSSSVNAKVLLDDIKSGKFQ